MLGWWRKKDIMNDGLTNTNIDALIGYLDEKNKTNKTKQKPGTFCARFFW